MWAMADIILQLLSPSAKIYAGGIAVECQYALIFAEQNSKYNGVNGNCKTLRALSSLCFQELCSL